MLQGDIALQVIQSMRLVWLAGRVGGGKTSLAVRCGIEFVERGWSRHILTNFPCAVATPLNVLTELRDVFVILDEAGAWMDNALFDQVVAYLRKRNVTVFMPSYLAPPTRGRSLYIQRYFNGHRMGLDLWHYKARYKNQFIDDTFTLNWWHPGEVFGLFDTSHVASDDAGIIDLFIDTFGKVQRGLTARMKAQGASASADPTADLVRGIEELTDAVTSPAAAPRKRGKKR
jgi:hypothetical protein